MLSGNKPSDDEARKKPMAMDVDESDGKEEEVKEPSPEELQKQSPLMEVAELRYLLTLTDDEMGGGRAGVVDRLIGLIKQHSTYRTLSAVLPHAAYRVGGVH
jgi:hypothetical protein